MRYAALPCRDGPALVPCGPVGNVSVSMRPRRGYRRLVCVSAAPGDATASRSPLASCRKQRIGVFRYAGAAHAGEAARRWRPGVRLPQRPLRVALWRDAEGGRHGRRLGGQPARLPVFSTAARAPTHRGRPARVNALRRLRHSEGVTLSPAGARTTSEGGPGANPEAVAERRFPIATSAAACGQPAAGRPLAAAGSATRCARSRASRREGDDVRLATRRNGSRPRRRRLLYGRGGNDLLQVRGPRSTDRPKGPPPGGSAGTCGDGVADGSSGPGPPARRRPRVDSRRRTLRRPHALADFAPIRFRCGRARPTVGGGRTPRGCERSASYPGPGEAGPRGRAVCVSQTPRGGSASALPCRAARRSWVDQPERLTHPLPPPRDSPMLGERVCRRRGAVTTCGDSDSPGCPSRDGA